MRLLRKDEKQIQVWRQEVTSHYLGMEQQKWQKERLLYGRVIPAESHLACAIYGSRIEKMVEIYLADGQLAEGEGISLLPATNGPQYRVVESRNYGNHCRVLGERL